MGLFSQPGLFIQLAGESGLRMVEGPAAVEVYGEVARAFHGTGAQLTPQLEALLTQGHAEIDKLKAASGGMLGAMLTALIPPAMALAGERSALTPDHLTQRGNTKKHRHYLLWSFAPEPLPFRLSVRPQGFFFPLTQLVRPVQDIETGDPVLDKGAVIQSDDPGQATLWLRPGRLAPVLGNARDWQVTQAGVGVVLPESELTRSGTLRAWLEKLSAVF